MTAFDDIYGSKHFSNPDLNGGQLRVKIIKVAVADLHDKDGMPNKKLVTYFEGYEKGLVLNETNALRLAEAYGKDPSKWIGQHIDLYSEMTDLGKEGVRVRALRKSVTPRPDTKMDDASPF